MKRMLLWLSLLLLIGCTLSPLGRKQLKLLPDSQMNEMGVAAFQELKDSTPQSEDPQLRAYVICVADAVTAQAQDETGVADWEVRVFKDDTPNAFALPGGKIGVHTGMFKVTENAAQLAAVIAHEVGHVIAGHGNERVSTAMTAELGLNLAALLAKDKSPQDRANLLNLLGVGAQVAVLLPYSRIQESEADLIGLDMMAKAGFDPRASVQLWLNMMEQGGGGTPEFLSTHPSDQTRIEDLQKRMPSALKLYESARASGLRPGCTQPAGAGGE